MAAEDVVKKLADAFNKHDVNAMIACYASDVVAHDPFYPQPLKGKEALKKDAEDFLKAFPDIRFTMSNLMGKGDTAAVEVVVTGTHKGPLVGPQGTIPATNKRITIRGAMFCRTNAQGLVAEETRYFDAAGMMAQLGLKP